MLLEMPSQLESQLQKTLLGIISMRLDYQYRNNYAAFVNINTQTVEMDNGSKKAKLVVTLKKHEQYQENMKRFNEISEENKAKAEKENPTP